MFRVRMMPASYGDALWIEYGPEDAPKRVLVDGGKSSTAAKLAERMRRVAEGREDGRCPIELAVLSHIDGDHIEGFLKLMNNLGTEAVPASFDDIWFNGAPQLPAPGSAPPAAPGEMELLDFNAVQGEMLGAVLLSRSLPWNRWSEGRPIFVPDEGPLPTTVLPGGLRLTLLGPSWQRLLELRAEWDEKLEDWLADHELEDLDAEAALELLASRNEGSAISFAPPRIDVEELLGPEGAAVTEDCGRPNGSSIALLAEYEGASCLLAGDAFARDLARSIRRLLAERAGGGEPAPRLKLSALKLPHHGSDRNITEELLALLDCDDFLISTNGANFGHPDRAAIARIVAGAGRRNAAFRRAHPARLHFNYRSPETVDWGERKLMAKWSYAARYPESKAGGLVVEL